MLILSSRHPSKRGRRDSFIPTPYSQRLTEHHSSQVAAVGPEHTMASGYLQQCSLSCISTSGTKQPWKCPRNQEWVEERRKRWIRSSQSESWSEAFVRHIKSKCTEMKQIWKKWKFHAAPKGPNNNMKHAAFLESTPLPDSARIVTLASPGPHLMSF